MKKVHLETTKGEIVAELFEDDAPATVANFAGLANGTKEWVEPSTGKKVSRPFYDGLTFHRVIPNFVIQGGCPLGDGNRGPWLQDQVRDRGKRQVHKAGSLSMAHAGKDTGGSQFLHLPLAAAASRSQAHRVWASNFRLGGVEEDPGRRSHDQGLDRGVTQPSLLDVMVRMFWSEGSCVRFGRRGLLAAACLTFEPARGR